MVQWLLKNKNADIKELSEKVKTSMFITKLLVNRGFKEAEDIKGYLNSSLKNLINPYSMKDIEKAADIAVEKILLRKKILVVGDFDADGIFSTYCLHKALKQCGAEVEYYIPHRISEGYGINIAIIENAYNDGYDTIITCDNGISAKDQIKRAKELGLTVVITDHHDIPFEVGKDNEIIMSIPPADAIVNPKQPDCRYPFKNLCGAGIVLKFIQVLNEKCGKKNEDWIEFFQYASIATVCDVVDLLGENRIIVKKGLEQLNSTDNTGLKALITASGLAGKEILSYHLGFVLGPCINATGRLETASLSLELLMSTDEAEALILAERLVALNKERKEMTEKSVEAVINKINCENLISDKVFVIYDESIHESIAGIVAGRVKEKYYTPTIILTKGHEMAKGSARSIEKYNIFEELTKLRYLLGKFGGHPMAAGLSLLNENIDVLRTALNENSSLTAEDKIPKLLIDMHLPLENLSFGVIEDIKKLEPFGKGNARPVFAEKNIQVLRARVMGKNMNMLKLSLRSLKGTIIEALQFEGVEKFQEFIRKNYGNQYGRYSQGLQLNDVKIDLVYSPSVNEYGGSKTLQLQITDYRKSN